MWIAVQVSADSMKQLGDVREKALIDIKRKLKEGKTAHEITDWVRTNYEGVKKANVFWLIKEAQENISRELDFNLRDIMIKHSSRYEQIWKKNYSNPYSKVLENPDQDMEDQDVRKTLHKIANHYMVAAKALQQKEKMLGLVHNRMDVQLKNELEEREERAEASLSSSNLDLTKLTLEEKKEMLALLKKAKGEEDKVHTKVTTTVTVTQGAKEEPPKYEDVVSKLDVEDIDHEEVIEPDKLALVETINKNLIKDESNKFNQDMEDKKEALRQRKLEENKKLLLEKLSKKKQ